MAKFRKDGKKEVPQVSTSALPDIVFMLLFFFMVSTTMREVTLRVKLELPEATEIKKIEQKSLVSYIYIGPPMEKYWSDLGKAPRMQLNDQFAELSDIKSYIENERSARQEADVPKMWTSLKIDERTQMGIIIDIKEELKEVRALKINYSSKRRLTDL